MFGKKTAATEFNTIISGVELVTGEIAIKSGAKMVINDGKHKVKSIASLIDAANTGGSSLIVEQGASLIVTTINVSQLVVRGEIRLIGNDATIQTQRVTVEDGGVIYWDGPTEGDTIGDDGLRSNNHSNLLVSGTLSAQGGGKVSGINNIRVGTLRMDSKGEVWGNIQPYNGDVPAPVGLGVTVSVED